METERRRMKMLFAVAIVAIVALPGGARAARSWLWCETSQAYFPWVRSCAVPWRRVDPRTAAQQPYPGQQPDSTREAFDARSAARARADGALRHQNFPARGDALDAWCRGVTTALNAAQCGDDELRALAIERLHAFDAAAGQLPADRRKVLAADQNGWAMAYPQGCGLQPNAPPALPLAPSVKACLLRERARLTYLRDYNGQAATGDGSRDADLRAIVSARQHTGHDAAACHEPAAGSAEQGSTAGEWRHSGNPRNGGARLAGAGDPHAVTSGPDPRNRIRRVPI